MSIEQQTAKKTVIVKDVYINIHGSKLDQF